MAEKQWFEKEAFWVNYGPIMFDTSRWAEAPTVAESICKIAGLSEGSSILDAGCGPGRISVELALNKLAVTGVDLIEPFLEAAKESAKDEGVEIDFVQADLRTYQAKHKFDAAVNLYTSFGYCDTIEEDIQILKRIADSLKDGGFFILESLSRENAVRDFIEGDRDLGVAFQTHPGRQAFISSGSKEPRSALESRRVSLGAHWVD